jgi:hypothetical protein
MTDSEAAASCAACGQALPLKQGRGRRQQYCNATCRSAARRQRDRAADAAAPVVNLKLTVEHRHDNLDTVLGRDSGAAAAPVTGGAPEPALASTDSPLTAITTARQMVAEAESALQQAVDRARATGHSWREIGEVLDTTRQAAFQRFGRPVDPRTGAPMSRAVVPGATDKAIVIFSSMAAGRWEEARRDFGATMQSRLDADRLAAGWAQTIGLIGSFERMGEPVAYPFGDTTVTDIPLYFEAGERTGRVSFDPDGKVVGLFIRPASA